MKLISVINFVWSIILIATCDLTQAQVVSLSPKYFTVSTKDFSLKINSQGSVDDAFKGRTVIEGCKQNGLTQVTTLKSGGYSFIKNLSDSLNHTVELTERFIPTGNSIRWEIDILSNDKSFWSTSINSTFSFLIHGSQFWTTWGNPDNIEDHINQWQDPFVWKDFSNKNWNYQYHQWQDVYVDSPSKGESFFSIPMFCVSNAKRAKTITVVQSPEDVLLNLILTENSNGELVLSRTNYRLGKNVKIHFSMDIITHFNDMKAALGWVVNRYPIFFNPQNKIADSIIGCGAYSGYEQPFNVERLRKMAFRINWKCSEDFPFMGLFLPPVSDVNEKWTRAKDEKTPGKPDWTTIQTLRNYSVWMRKQGFYVLNYFNVTEFGSWMKYPLTLGYSNKDSITWKNPHDWIKMNGFENAILFDRHDKPTYSNCYGAFIMDVGDEYYRKYMLHQAKLYIEKIPESSGIAIDRLDWLNSYNLNADDGISWINGQPARSLFISWKRYMEKLSPLMHNAGKVIFVNNCIPRIEVYKNIDGIYGEWWFDPFFNYIAYCSLRRPAIIWTADENVIRKAGGDNYMQRCLYLGIYPTAPYPNNNHCLLPSSYVDSLYTDYGRLLDAIRGKKWVLEPNCIETNTKGVKVNLFEVSTGYVLPVTFGGTAESAVVHVRNISGLDKMKVTVIHPGADAEVPVVSTYKDGILEIVVPLKRGCGMVKLKNETKQ